MRRLAAAVFKRTDKSDASSSAHDDPLADDTHLAVDPKLRPAAVNKQRPSFFRSLSRKTQLAPPTLPTLDSTSSASSSASTGPCTPDDDAASSFRAAAARKAWAPNTPDDDDLHEHITQHPPTPRLPPPRDSLSSDEQSEETDSDDDLPLADSPQPAPSSSSPAPSSSSSAVAYARTLTLNALATLPTPPPLVLVPDAPLYPRSCNPARALPNASPGHLADSIFRHLLLRRLLSRPLNPGSPTHAHAASLAPYAARPPQPPAPPLASPFTDLAAVALRPGTRLSMHSPGLRRWAGRPRFEDRVAVYLPAPPHAPEHVRCVPVSGTGLGVLDLEFSPELEALAGLFEEEPAPADARGTLPAWAHDAATPPLSQSTTGTPASSAPPTPTSLSPVSAQSHASHPSQPSRPAQPPDPLAGTPPAPPRGAQYKAAPSPLRIQTSPEPPVLPPVAVASPLQESPSLSPSPAADPASAMVSHSPSSSTTATVKPPARPGVRFATPEEDAVDAARGAEGIPLDYVKRLRAQRERKARFLAEERARREAALKEEERQRNEQERQRNEQERARRDQERRAAEEERKRRMYQEEVVRARARRESQRFDQDWERARERERRGREAKPDFARAAHDDHPRQASEPRAQRHSSPHPPSSPLRFPQRPESVGGSAPKPLPSPSSTSTRSVSTPDVRTPGARADGTRRISQVSQVSDHGARPWLTPGGSPAMNPRLSAVPQLPMTLSMMSPMMPVPVPVAVPVAMYNPAMGMGMYGQGMGMHGQGMGMYGQGLLDPNAPLLPPSPPFAGHRSRASSPGSSRSASQERSGSRSRTSSSGRSPAPSASANANAHANASGAPATPSSWHYPYASPAPSPSPSQHSGSGASSHRASIATTQPASAAHAHASASAQHHRRSSAEADLHQMQQSRGRAGSDHRASRPAPPIHQASMPTPRHLAPISTPTPAIAPQRTARPPAEGGFQILSRPNAGRRATMIS